MAGRASHPGRGARRRWTSAPLVADDVRRTGSNPRSAVTFVRRPLATSIAASDPSAASNTRTPWSIAADPAPSTRTLCRPVRRSTASMGQGRLVQEPNATPRSPATPSSGPVPSNGVTPPVAGSSTRIRQARSPQDATPSRPSGKPRQLRRVGGPEPVVQGQARQDAPRDAPGRRTAPDALVGARDTVDAMLPRRRSRPGRAARPGSRIAPGPARSHTRVRCPAAGAGTRSRRPRSRARRHWRAPRPTTRVTGPRAARIRRSGPGSAAGPPAIRGRPGPDPAGTRPQRSRPRRHPHPRRSPGMAAAATAAPQPPAPVFVPTRGGWPAPPRRAFRFLPGIARAPRGTSSGGWFGGGRRARWP